MGAQCGTSVAEEVLSDLRLAQLRQVYFISIDTSARLVHFDDSNSLTSTGILAVEASEQVII